MAEWVFLGTGTSHGVPMIACDCSVCRSENPRNKRTRTSSLLVIGGRTILIDPGIDFRQQALREDLRHLDAVLVTHSHADHMFGLDDIRRFNHFQPEPIPVYADPATVARLRQVFSYVFTPCGQEGGGIPRIALQEIGGPFEAGGIPVLPIPVMHGLLEITSFRIGPVGYVTDCSRIPEASYPMLSGVRYLILGALRHTPHPTHFSLSQAVEAAQRIHPERTFFVHISHRLDHEPVNASLPAGMELAFDGMRFEFDME